MLSPPDAENEESKWQGAFRFALQGLILTAVIVALVGKGFGLVLIKPKPPSDEVVSRLKEIREGLLSANDDTLFFKAKYLLNEPTEASAEDVMDAAPLAISGNEDIDTVLDRHFWSPHQYVQAIDNALWWRSARSRAAKFGETLRAFLVPLTLLCSSLLFRRFLRKSARDGTNSELGDRIYLYLTTTHFFWINLYFAAFVAFCQNFVTYGNQNIQGAALLVFGIGQFLFILGALPAYRRFSRATRLLLKLPQKNFLFCRVTGDMVKAQFITVVLLVLLFFPLQIALGIAAEFASTWKVNLNV